MSEVEISFNQNSHPGNHPIRVLRHNVVKHFESIRDTTFKTLEQGILKGKVKPGIVVNIDEEPVGSPYADCDSNTIHINENYMAFAWAMCYYFFVVFEEAVQKKQAKGTFDGTIVYDTELLKRAKGLYNWALTLTNKFSHWSMDLPNPESPANGQERWYAEKVNGIYLDVMIYDLFHEFSHLNNDHCAALREILTKSSYLLTKEDTALCKQIEVEADNYAFDSIVDEHDKETYKLHKGVAIILAHCITLFVIKNPRSVKQSMHPDIDSRILYSVTRLNLTDVDSEEYLWYLGSLACNHFFSYHEIPIDNSEAQTAKDVFFRYLSKFDEIKK